MKKTVLTLSLLAAPLTTQADYVMENSPLCLTYRAAKAYAGNVAAGQMQFNQDLLDRAACYIQEDAAMVALTDTGKEFLQVQLPTGHKMWVENSFYKVGDLPEPAAEVGVSAEDVAEKPSWVGRIKGYLSRD